MVLTNFEFWAADGVSSSMPPSASSLEFESTRHLNPFDPRVVPHVPVSNLTHMSSNGYYGFSYINAAHDMEPNNNNNIDIINNNNNNHSPSQNNNCTTTHNFMANDVNGTNDTTSQHHHQQQQPTHICANFAQRTADPPPAGTASRCKKRFFVLCENDDIGADANAKCTAADGNVSAKRCRFDDDFAAQYCNDFFSLPSTQIATQSCLMDTEEGLPLQQQQQHQYHQQLHQHHQHQVVGDEAMLENNNNVSFNNNNNNVEKYEQSILHLQLQNQQLQQQQQSQILHSQLTPTTLLQQQLYQQQQHQQQEQQKQQQQQLPEQQTQSASYHQQQHYQDKVTINTSYQPNVPCFDNFQQQRKTHMKRLLNDTWPHSKAHNDNDILCKKIKQDFKNSNVFQTKPLHDVDVGFDAKSNSNETQIDEATLFSCIHGGSWQHFTGAN